MCNKSEGHFLDWYKNSFDSKHVEQAAAAAVKYLTGPDELSDADDYARATFANDQDAIAKLRIYAQGAFSVSGFNKSAMGNTW